MKHRNACCNHMATKAIPYNWKTCHAADTEYSASETSPGVRKRMLICSRSEREFVYPGVLCQPLPLVIERFLANVDKRAFLSSREGSVARVTRVASKRHVLTPFILTH